METEPTPWKGIHSLEFDEWARTCVEQAAARQAPADELLAEHHLAAGVMLAMEEGANRMVKGVHLPDFWSGVVDFIGNFMHLVHRAKETHCFPLSVSAGTLGSDEADELQSEHKSAMQTTVDLIGAVEAGDWEAACRYVSLYVHVMRPHMAHEERTLVVGLRSLDAAGQAKLRAAFDEVERGAMQGRDRCYYLDLARRLCDLTGVVHPPRE